MSSSRLPALGGFVVFAVVLAGLIAFTTPWSVLPGKIPGGRLTANPRLDFTAAQIAREVAYHHAVRPPAYLSLAAALVAAGLIGLTSLGGRLATGLARPLGGGWPWQVILGGLAAALIARLAALPFDIWSQQVLLRYRISVEPWGLWFGDQAKGYAVTAVLIVLVVPLFYALARALPNRWWLPAAVVGAGLVLIGSFLYPLAVEPLFAKFMKLPPGPLRSSIVQLARQDGLHISDVLVANASLRTTAEDAYVSGYGSTRRIVIYDTLVTAPPEQVRLVIAHELGHAKNQDVLRGTIEGALGVGAGVCLLYLLMSSPAVLKRSGADAPADPRSVALLLFFVAAATFVVTPVQNLVSRHIEARADIHALNVTHDPATYIGVQRRLALTGLSDLHPNSAIYVLFFDHPSAPQRIALARDWARQHHVAVPARTVG
jgi:STE24 endopeptidase